MTDDTTITEPRKRGRPPKNQIPAGKRGTMKDGIRKYVSRDGRTVRYQVKVSAFDPTTGKRRSVWKTFSTETDAKAARDSYRMDRRKGQLVFPATTTVAEWVTTFATGYQGATTSRERYIQHARHISDAFGMMRLQSLTPDAVERFRDGLPQGPRTRAAILMVLKAACGKAVAQGLLKANPCAGVTMPRAPEGETRPVLSPEDIGALLHLLAGSDYWLPVAVLAFTGLRRGELFAVRWRAIDFAEGTLHVGGTVWRTKEGLTIEAPKTRASRRTIPINGALVAQLRRHKATQAELGLQLGDQQTDEWLVFPRGSSAPLTAGWALLPRDPRGLASGLKNHLRGTRFADLTLHQLRHAHGSALLADGVGPKLVAQRLGHSVVELLRTYAHVLDRDSVSAAEKFAAKVAKSGSGIPGAPTDDSSAKSNILTLNT